MALAVSGLAGALELTPPLPVREHAPLAAWGTAAATAMPAAAVLPSASPIVVEPPVDSAGLERELLARFEHRPLARVLGTRTRERGMAERIARALVKEARHLRVEPSLLAGVLLTENARLEPGSVSSQGAIGLMQVMHFHAGEYECDSNDLLQVESNICHGSRVFGYYLRRTGDVRRALLRYNGCVRGTNTPNCGRYPGKVLRAARTVRHELLRYPLYRLGLDGRAGQGAGRVVGQ